MSLLLYKIYKEQANWPKDKPNSGAKWRITMITHEGIELKPALEGEITRRTLMPRKNYIQSHSAG